MFALEEEACGIKKEISSATSSASNLAEDGTTPAAPPKSQEVQSRPQPRLHALTVEREVTNEDLYESDDEIGDDEDSKVVKKPRNRRSKVTVDPQAILLGAPDFR